MLKRAYHLPDIQQPVSLAPERRLAAYHVALPSWNVLLVEDDPSDVALTRHALKRAYIPHHLHSVASGTDAVKALRGACWPEFSLPPDVVFLDLNLPDKDGFALLAEISSMAERFHQIPFVILTKFEHYQYITRTYDLWIPAYLTKPCTPEKMMEVFAMLGRRERMKGARKISAHESRVLAPACGDKKNAPYKWRNTKCKSGIKSRLTWPHSWLG